MSQGLQLIFCAGNIRRLSRYRLDNVRLVPFAFQGHDWYADEKEGVAPFEAGKRFAGKQVFLEKVLREVRRRSKRLRIRSSSRAI